MIRTPPALLQADSYYPPSRGLEDPPKPAHFSPRLGFSTNVYDNPADIVGVTREIITYFTDIEIELEDEAGDIVFSADSAEYQRLVSQLGALLSDKDRQISVHAPYLSRSTNLAASDDSIRRGAIEHVERAVQFCADIGGDRVTYHPGFITKGEDVAQLTDNLKRSIERLQKTATALNVRLCLENMGNSRPKYLVYSPEQHVELHRQTGSWVTLDLVHLASWLPSAEELDRQLQIYAPIVANIHVNDMPAGKHRHIPLGQGVLPIVPLLRRLAELGYAGAAIVDEFARPIPAGEYRRCAHEFMLSAA